MPDIADAPWIREAENDGMPYVPNPDCPICGAKDVERFYFNKYDLYREIIRCENCIISDSADTF